MKEEHCEDVQESKEGPIPFPGILKAAQDAVQGAGGFVVDAANGVGGFVGQLISGNAGDEERQVSALEEEVKEAPENYVAPNPIYDARELRELDDLTERYEKLTAPGLFDRAGETVMGLLPEEIKNVAKRCC